MSAGEKTEFNLPGKKADLKEVDIVNLNVLRKEYNVQYTPGTIKTYLAASPYYYFTIRTGVNKKDTYIQRDDINSFIDFLDNYVNGYAWKNVLTSLGFHSSHTYPNEMLVDFLRDKFHYVIPGNVLRVNRTEFERYLNDVQTKSAKFYFRITGKNGSPCLLEYDKSCECYLDDSDVMLSLKNLPTNLECVKIYHVKDYTPEYIIRDNKIYYKNTGEHVDENIGELSTRTIRNFYKDWFVSNGTYYISERELNDVIDTKRILLVDLFNRAAQMIKIPTNGKAISKSYYDIQELFAPGVVDLFQRGGYAKEMVYFYQTEDFEKELDDACEIIIDSNVMPVKSLYAPYIYYKIDRYLKKHVDQQTNILLFKEFVDTCDLSNSNKYRNTVFIQVLDHIVNNVKRENICGCSTQEVLALNDDNTTFHARAILKAFLDYLIRKYNAKFDTYYLVSSSFVRASDNISDKNDDIYSKRDWEKLIVHLCSINKHIEHAFNDVKYARCWFYYLVCISMAWRKSDIYNLPPVNFCDIDVYDLDWFKTNDFTVGMAQNLIKQYTDYANRTLIEKTHAHKHFIVPNAIVLPFAIALIILEKHGMGNQTRNNVFGINEACTVECRQNFNKENLDIVGSFTTLKANRSFITYGNEYAAHSVKFSYGGYALLSQSRGHKLNETGLSNTTSIYVRSTDNDGTIDDVCLGMFNRGLFGWLYYSIIKMTADVDRLKFCDINHIIDSIKQEIGAFGIENVTGWINNEAISRQAILKEIAGWNDDEIGNLLSRINSKNAISKSDNIMCMLADTTNDCYCSCCPNPLNKNCIMCKYSIPTTYSLYSISNMLVDLLVKTNGLPETDVFHRKMYAGHMLKLLSIVGQAKLQFKDIGDDYVNAFLKIDEVKRLVANHYLLKGE